jgi:glycerol-3-phosphate acyltransferase PlsY
LYSEKKEKRKMVDAALIAALIIAYLLGNISPAILLGKMAGVDIKKEGSGNAGTTNTLRVLGKKAAVLTLLIDVGKGIVAVLIGQGLAGEQAAMACGLLAFVGHIWPVFFHFKGGKGVATAFGVVLALEPLLALIGLGIMVVTVLITRRVSAGSVITAIALPFIGNLINPDHLWWTLIMAVIILYKHSSNISRLMKGEEPPLQFRKSK